jgi:hypothetical protein
MPKASQEKRERRAAKEITDIILASLERFPAKERKAKLDRMHVILAGADQRSRGKSSKSSRTRVSRPISRPRAVR